MARDDWPVRLEAYLDGELDPADAAAFEAETAADPALQAELAGRRAFREAARGALIGDPAAGFAGLADPALHAGRRPGALGTHRGEVGRRRPRSWQVLALAATVAAALLVPRLLRNEHGAEGPRSSITRAGQVAAVRFGEQPGETVQLEAGVYDLSTDRVQ